MNVKCQTNKIRFQYIHPVFITVIIVLLNKTSTIIKDDAQSKIST